MLFEACVEGADGVQAAERGGADRAELCASLTEGGLSPSPGAVELAVATAGIPIMCMVRPRGGDFCYTDAEFGSMLADIAAYKKAGVHGLVFGVLLPDGTVDAERTRQLVAASRPLPVTFHRAFDMTIDAAAALETLVELGVERVLTSGQAATAPEGAKTIARLVKQAGGRIVVLAGSGIEVGNVAQLIAKTGLTEVHATAFGRSPSPMIYQNERVYMGVPGLPEYERRVTDVEEVRRLVAAVHAARA